MSIELILAVFFVVFLGALTRTAFGFGEAVVSMPLLTLLPVNLHTSVSLMGLVGITVALFSATTGWRYINRKELIPLVFSALAGVPIGLVMIIFILAKVMYGLLGISLIAYGGYSLYTQLISSNEINEGIQNPVWGLLFGFISGVLGSAYNFTGVPIAVYGSLRGWHPQTFRGTMQAYFLLSGTLIVAGQGMSGMWNANVFTLYLFSLPAIVAAIIVGTILHRKIPTANFQRYVFLLIATLGAVLLVKSII